MSGVFISIGGAMFGVPLILMLAIALAGADIPTFLLSVGGWSMAFGLIVAGIGAFLNLSGG